MKLLTKEELCKGLAKMHRQSDYYIKEWGLHFNVGEEQKIVDLLKILKNDPKLCNKCTEAEQLLKDLNIKY